MRTATAVFIVSAATLLLEITYTRVLSVSHWHNFAFLVISTALLGFGASGALLSMAGGHIGRRPGASAALFSLLFGAAAPAALAAGNALRFDEVMFSFDFRQMSVFLLFYLVFAVPFFFAGCAIGSAIWTHAERVGGIYAANLGGSALGCLGIFLLIPSFGGVKLVFLCGLAGLLAAILFMGGERRALRGTAAALLAVTALALYALPPPFALRISSFKALPYFLSLPDGKLEETEWNAISRTGAASSRYIRIPPAGLSLNFTGVIPPQVAITSDADSPSPVTDYGGSPEKLAFAGACVQALPYAMGRRESALVIGSGGGLDCLTALRGGAGRITAVEVNPDVIGLVTGRYAAYSGGLFSRPGVELVRAEGRHFLRRGGGRYDVIQVPLFDSVAASSAGVHGFSESYLYTAESFRDCLARLSPGGILCVTRWIKYPPRESLRLLGLGLAALEAEGVESPAAQVALVRSWSTTALLVSSRPFDDNDTAALKEFCDRWGFDPVYFPGITPDDANRHNVIAGAPYYTLASRLIAGPARFFRDYPYDVSPPTDDKPFFYHFLTARALPRLLRTMGTGWTPFAEWGELVLYAALIQAVLVSVCLALLPLLGASRRGIKVSAAARAGTISYFFLIGLAFIAVEITLMQKFVLFLGHPAHAMSVILFSLLLFAGMGSRASGAMTGRLPLAVLCAILGLYSVSLSPLLDHLIGLRTTSRMLVTAALVAPPALLMGTAFPRGIRTAGRIDSRLIPWAWAVNGAGSVAGAVAAVIAALYTGFNLVLAIAAVLYALALLVLPHPESFVPHMRDE